MSDARRRQLGRLRRRRSRARERLVLVEGVRSCEEALRAGADLRWALCSPRLRSGDRGGRLADALERSGQDVVWVTDEELGDVADTEAPQGVLIVTKEPSPALEAMVTPRARLLIVDGVRDPGNLGTLVRVSAAFGLDGVVALDGSADPWGPKAVRGAAGTCFRIPVIQGDWPTVRSSLEEAELPLLVSAADGQDAGSMPHPSAWALVVGSEARGARDELRAAADRCVGIPMAGPVESLNAGVAGAILLYVLTRNAHHG